MALGQGDYATARALYAESMELCQEIGDKIGMADCLEGFAGLAVRQGQPERAARLFGMEEALREAGGAALKLFDRPYYERHTAAVRAALGEEAFAAAWAEGRAMTLEQAVIYALDR